MPEDRLISAENQTSRDPALRPLHLADFIGQGQGRRNLETFIHAATGRDDAMDHTLLHGPPGLGKTYHGTDYSQRAWCGVQRPHQGL